jgi:hypothetical protein
MQTGRHEGAFYFSYRDDPTDPYGRPTMKPARPIQLIT